VTNILSLLLIDDNEKLQSDSYKCGFKHMNVVEIAKRSKRIGKTENEGTWNL
jgi:hypothetical protein